ncbi:Na+/H+ antiporter NhaD/arsenite permease-like protein [Rossellomorea marisflavi]
MNGILFFVAFIILYFIGSFILGKILRRKLRLNKRTREHHNEIHRQWDKRVRVMLLVLLLILLGVCYYHDFSPMYVYISSVIGLLFQELFQAYMDWKYSEKRNEYVRSLIEAGYMAFGLTLFIAILSTSIL